MAAKPHPSFHLPANPDVKIWRYMTLTKFLWMLQKSALYFSRSDLLGDPFEGHYTQANLLEEDEFVRLQMSSPEFAKFGEQRHRDNFKIILCGSSSTKSELFVSCWHMNDEESLAMWKLYAAQHDSICIQSTCSKIAQLLPDDTFLGTVSYIDYNTQRIPLGNAWITSFINASASNMKKSCVQCFGGQR